MADLLDRVVPLANPRGFPLAVPDASQPCGALMKGFALQHLEELVAERHGPEALRPWLDGLPARFRDQADPQAIVSVGWVPIELYYGALTFVVNRFHGGDVRHALVMGHAAATRDIGAFFRAALRFAAPPTILGLSGRFWRSYFDRSQLVLTTKDTGMVEAEVREWPLPDAVSIYEVAGSLVAWMESSHARDVTITRLELLSPNTFAMRAQWKQRGA